MTLQHHLPGTHSCLQMDALLYNYTAHTPLRKEKWRAMRYIVLRILLISARRAMYSIALRWLLITVHAEQCNVMLSEFLLQWTQSTALYCYSN